MTDTETAAAAELARLGEAYFAAQHSYDPYNATLLGVEEFDGLSFDPSREASERTAQELAASRPGALPADDQSGRALPLRVRGARSGRDSICAGSTTRCCANGAIPLTLLDDEIERWTTTEA
jgi:hypothetical protein